MVQVVEIYGLKAKFTIYKGSDGRITKSGEFTLLKEHFLTFLQNGEFPDDQ
jgi:hypothetical protein